MLLYGMAALRFFSGAFAAEDSVTRQSGSGEIRGLGTEMRQWARSRLRDEERKELGRFGLWRCGGKDWAKLDDAPFSPRAILLVHGLDDTGLMWKDLSPRLMEPGREVLRLEYPDDEPIADAVKFMAAQMRLLRLRGVESVDIIAHSMGGLVARGVLTQPDCYGGDAAGDGRYPAVVRLITVGTPNKGSSFVHLRWITELKEQSVKLACGRAGLFSAFFDGRGEAKKDLLPGSDFLAGLNSRPLPVNVAITVIAGRMSPEMRGELRREALPLAGESESRSLRRAFARFADFWNDSADLVGDGVVSVDSACLPGVDDFVIVHGSHASMLINLLPSGDLPPAIPVILDRLRSSGNIAVKRP